MQHALKRFLSESQNTFFRFIDKRVRVSDEHRLSQKNLFIFPTRRGFVFLLVVIALWVLGTNYQNNLILALAFFMISLFVLAILLTFQNLNGLSLRYVSPVNDAFAGSEVILRFDVSKSSRASGEEVELIWFESEQDTMTIHSVPEVKKEYHIPLFCDKRGRRSLPRMCVQSYFPLGIIRCWTWLRWDSDLVVFPKPVNGKFVSHQQSAEQETDGLHPVKGAGDFSGLKEYVPGDSLRRVSWKTLAKGRGLFVKEFSESLNSELWLDFDSVSAVSAEEKLSILSFWVLHFFQEDEHFGLILPTCKRTPNKGSAHRLDCLTLLAEF